MPAPKTPLAAERRRVETALRRAERAQQQGPQAKRNARTAVLNALRALKRAVDREYPVQRRNAGKPRKRRTPEQRAKALVKQGYILITNSHAIATLAAAGIKIVKIQRGELGKSLPDIYGPRWAVVIASKYPRKLAAAKRSTAVRKELLAAADLKSHDW